LAGIKENVVQGHYHTALGLLGLQVSHFLACACQLILSSRRLILRRRSFVLCCRRRAARALYFTLACLQLNAVTLILRLSNLLPRVSLGDPSLTRLRMAKSKVREVIHVLLRRVLLQCRLGALQVIASLLDISASGLLRQGVGRNLLYFRAGLIELVAVHRGRRASCDKCH
jgi:hypothetical protein